MMRITRLGLIASLTLLLVVSSDSVAMANTSFDVDMTGVGSFTDSLVTWSSEKLATFWLGGYY